MDRNKAKELLPIIQAYAEGKSIEYSSITDVSKAWREVTYFPLGMIDSFKFRIKPEPKYRSFKDAKECWAEMQKHQPFGYAKDRNGGKFIIGAVDSDNTIFVCEDGTRTFDEMFKYYTFADGTPFGVKEE